MQRPDAKSRGPVADVRDFNGAPTLFLDGQPVPGIMYNHTRAVEPARAAAYIGDFGRRGVDLVGFEFKLSWPRDGHYDFSALDRAIDSTLAANPQALILPRVWVGPPPQWLAAHPDDCVRKEDGTRWEGWSPYQRQHANVVSWTSPIWRAEACEALAQMIRHIQSRDDAGHVVGYHLAHGHTGEWFWWGYSDDCPLDFNPSYRDAFVAFLRRRYHTETALRQAWRDERVTFDTVTLPGRAERRQGDDGVLRHTARSCRLLDFYTFHNAVLVETIERLAAVVKSATDRRQLCGVFYGYIGASAESGHLALGRLLACRDIDFLAAPSAYWCRQLGSGQSRLDSPAASVRLHGKLWFDENDYRTFLTPPGSGYGRTDNRRDCIEVQKRELALIVSEASAMWWYDMTGGWFDDPAFMEALGSINRIAERSVRVDRSSVAETAVCFDEDSIRFLRPERGNASIGTRLCARLKLELARIGAPVDYLLQDDLAHARPYRFYIMLNAYHMPAERRLLIDRVVKQRGATVLWLYAGGYDGGPEDRMSRMEDVTGFRLARRGGPHLTAARVTAAGIAFGIGARGRKRWDGGVLDPLFYVDDADAETLAVRDGGGESVLAVKRFADWTAIYASGVYLPKGVLRALACRAGVHSYASRDDALYVNASFIGIHTDAAGPRRLRFPVPTDLTDVFSGRQLAHGVTAHTVMLEARSTALYFRGSREAWEAISVHGE